VLALTNCLFDASSALFLPLQLLHGWAPRTFSRRHWFIATAALAAATFAGVASLGRRRHLHSHIACMI
jgi:hypothetical protein